MPLWAALRFVQWEDTISFHARVFRCFFLGLLDAHSELAVLSQRSEWMLAVLGQRLAGMGLIHDAGHLYEPISHRASPLAGRHNDATRRCPPKKRYETTSLPSFAVTSPTDPAAPVPPFVFSHPINFTHGHYDELMPPVVTFSPPGSGRAPGGYDGPPTRVVGFLLLGLLTLAIIISRRASKGSGSVRCLSRRVAVDSSNDLGERMIRTLPHEHLPIDEVTPGVVTATPERVDHQTSMPGAWLSEHQEQSVFETLEESVFGAVPWMLFYSCVQMGMKAWAHFPGLTSIIGTFDPRNRGLNDVAIIERKFEDGCSPVRQGFDAGVSMPAALHRSEQQGAALDLSIDNLRRSTKTMLNRRCGPLAIGGMVARGPGLPRTTTLDIVCGNAIGFPFVSSNAKRLLCQGDISSDSDESASEGGSDEGLFGVSTQRADMAASVRKDEYRILGRRQDGASSHTGRTPSLRRACSSGCLWKKRDVFDNDDEGTGDDSYWTEQVNARLSGEQDSRRGSCRYSWSDVSSWPREGREDETDNWRTRSSHVTHFATPEKTSDAVRCQTDSDSTKLRRYSSPPLNVDTSLSHRAGSPTSGDGPQGIYVVPQKRRRTMGDRCWPPVASPRLSDRPPGLGFFPFRKTPSLLIPEAWRPGCLYVPDLPGDEARQADVWWDNLTSVSSCGSASAAGHRCGTGTVIQAAAEQGTPFSRDTPDAPVSWRDRYENDPASRRFNSVHRRAMTEG